MAQLPQGIEAYLPTSDQLPASDLFQALSRHPADWFQHDGEDNESLHFTKYNAFGKGMVQDQQGQLHYTAIHGSGPDRKVYVG